MSENTAIEWADHTFKKPSWKYKGNRHATFIETGHRRCSSCKTSKPLVDFDLDNSRPMGRAYVCKICRNDSARNRYIRKPRLGFGPKPYPSVDGNKKQARQKVNLLVRTKRLPHPNTLPCTDCNHTWTDGERRHEYDHYLGYQSEHHLSVQSVCTICHSRREEERGKNKNRMDG